MDSKVVLKIWGARGTIPSPGQEFVRYGGNTTCLSVSLGPDEHVILDCGSGLRHFGKSLGPPRPGTRRRFHVLMSHYHFDHVEGLPYFSPLFDPGSTFTIHGIETEGRTVQDTFEALIRPPYFPVTLQGSPAEVRYARAEGELNFGDLRAECVPLNHPDGSLAWRLTRGTKRVVFATDHEHGRDEIDEGLERFSRDADLLIYDATYIPSEYESLRRGWGHSTWYAAVALARAARVKTLALFHHHPDHSDDELERLLAFARADFPATELAREGMEFIF